MNSFYIVDDHTGEVLDYDEAVNESYAIILARSYGVSEKLITKDQYYRLRETGSI